MDIDGLKGTERRAVLTLYHLFTRYASVQRSARPDSVAETGAERCRLRPSRD